MRRPPELISWILGFGPEVRVEGPPALTERIRRLHQEAADGWSSLNEPSGLLQGPSVGQQPGLAR